MSTQKVTDYLTKQLFIEKNIVTFRSLSRELRIHVNDAKSELAVYHDQAPYQGQTAFATYLLSGELGRQQGSQSVNESQDVDMDEPENTQDSQEEEEDDDGYGGDGEEVVETTVMLVNEQDLEENQSKFNTLHSIHVYSLAPSPLKDAGLICTPNDSIRAVDVSAKAAEVASVVGRIVSPIITVPQFKKSSSKPKDGGKVPKPGAVAKESEKPKPPLKSGPSAPRTKANFFMAKPAEKKETTAEPPAKKAEATEVPAEKSKPSGRIDFGKAKPKETKESPAPLAKKATVVKKEPSPPPQETKKFPEPKPEQPKRGTKRKSSVGAMRERAEEEAGSPAASTSAVKTEKNLRVKKGALLSDDDDEEEEPPKKPAAKTKNARRQVDSDEENDVTGLMDIDDDKVTRISRTAPVSRKAESEDESEEADEVEDVDMDLDEPVPSAKHKKRRPKKQIPIGKNGLKKRRVVRNRQTVDDKGYTVFEDYTSYESVSEEEPEKPKLKAASKASAKVKKEEEKDSRPSTPKPAIKASAPKAKPAAKASTTKGQTKQKSLKNFFMPPQNKT